MPTCKISVSKKPSPALIGAVCAWIGVMIYAASNSIATVLVDIGQANPVSGGRNAITFTNLLFLGSLISLVPMVALFRKDWSRHNLQSLTQRHYGLLVLSAFLSSALTPGLFFFALEHSSVTNVVLVSRVEPPLFLIAACVFFKEKFDTRVMVAGMIALCGALLMIALREPGQICAFGVGEWAAFAATLSYIASAMIARKALQDIPMGIFSVVRTALGTAIYFVLICAIYGPQEFQDAFASVMLKWIWVYAIIVIVIGQLVWFVALKHARSSDVSLASSFSPLAGIVFAMVLLGENPGAGLLPGGALILLAVMIGQIKYAVLETVRTRVAQFSQSLVERLVFASWNVERATAPLAGVITQGRKYTRYRALS